MTLVFRILKSIPTLIRWGVSLAVTFSAVTAYIIAKRPLDTNVMYLMAGVFFLASGASSLNQVQEIRYDSLMNRTKNRPLVTGLINPTIALIISILLILSGFGILAIQFGKIPALFGLFNILWYNGFYTYLKRKSSFAIIPGALTGAIPVIIGWTAAGADIFDKRIILFAFFIFIWQVPHFWILLLKYNEEYIKAGFKTITQNISVRQLKLVIASWIISTSFTSLLFPVFGIIQDFKLILPLLLLNLLLVLLFFTLVYKDQVRKLTFIHIGINLFLVLSMMLIIIAQVL